MTDMSKICQQCGEMGVRKVTVRSDALSEGGGLTQCFNRCQKCADFFHAKLQEALRADRRDELAQCDFCGESKIMLAKLRLKIVVNGSPRERSFRRCGACTRHFQEMLNRAWDDKREVYG